MNLTLHSPPPQESWQAWHPEKLMERLTGIDLTWYVVGGWALDLWLGRQTREHEDLEFAILPEDFSACRQHLKELSFFSVHAGEIEPIAQHGAPPAHVSQFWGADVANARWRVDMMLERGTPSDWVYKRDAAISVPRATMVRRNQAGIPYLAPSAVLLFKAKYCRAKDERDFQTALRSLSAQDRSNLQAWLNYAHPGHAWLALL